MVETLPLTLSWLQRRQTRQLQGFPRSAASTAVVLYQPARASDIQPDPTEPCKHEQWCHLLKTALEDYKHEKTLGHQVQKYAPNIVTKYSVLPTSIEILFEKDVAKLVSNKLPGS